MDRVLAVMQTPDMQQLQELDNRTVARDARPQLELGLQIAARSERR
jgi:hypothetical protein